MPIFITVLKQSAGNKEKCNKVVHVSFLKLDKNVSSIKMFKMSPTNFVIINEILIISQVIYSTTIHS